ncbi:MAG TPA: aminotransferase class V-fold PLP-dependent enzyme, partial [Elusimicrobiota bacterium]|nr:aminotransferase class V-fold PLP-dependent enzyme [Elusimicrobiota bacterium]
AARGVESIRRAERARIDQFREGVRGIPGLRLFAPRSAEHQVAVFSFLFDGEDPQRSAARLWARHRLMVRAGLHCAPGAHRFIGTLPRGTFRFSFGPWTSAGDVARALRALRALAPRRRQLSTVPGDKVQ